MFGVESTWADVTFPTGTQIVFDATGYTGSNGMNIYIPGTSDVEADDAETQWWGNTKIKASVITFTLTENWTINSSAWIFKSEENSWNVVTGTTSPANDTYRRIVTTNGTSYSWTDGYDYTFTSVCQGYVNSVSYSQRGANASTVVIVTPAVSKVGFSAEVSVVDGSSNTVDVTDNGDGKFSFTMPASNVTVTATTALDNAYISSNSTEFNDAGLVINPGDDGTWYANQCAMTQDDVNPLIFTKTINLPAGTYNFKITSGAWPSDGASWGYTEVTPSFEGSFITSLTNNSGNIQLVTSAEDDITFTFTHSVSGKSTLSVTGTVRTVTCHYYNDANWSPLKVYAWENADDANKNATWPGNTEGLSANATHSGWYDYVVRETTGWNRLIFNNGEVGGGTGKQTGDIVLDFGTEPEIFVVSNGYWTDVNEVSVTTTAGGYASFYSDITVTVPAGLTVYSAEYNSVNNIVILHEESGYTTNGIPGHTGVILKGTASTDYTLTNTWNAGGSSSGNTNNLVGTFAPYTKSDTKTTYVLGHKGDETALYKYTGESQIPAHKAFLELPLGSPAPSLRIAEEIENTTNVDAIHATDKAVKFFENGKLFILREGVVYDVVGRVVK